ncbi:epoxide hydrolase [Microbacterium trichothecenolyticum]|uniref:epoxide hydrolase family protein n=1 Tax=Microbacterium trichothecenolyticum TaxID=69370 RepID=UPI001C6E137B|nr:epoxide hydrolase family protein [Microbacterium trichothecenolyticum]MBW9122166.1 epoxide hydrolase [Microbacterium trichothecenolyticum]
MDAITPYRIAISDEVLDDLRRRLDTTRWSDESPAEGRERGIRAGELRALADRWREGFDWRAVEARLNRIPQSITEIDGQRIHFFHARAQEEDAPVLLLTHGFPSSNAEFERLIQLLTATGDGQAFHVVAPALPGYGFSTPLSGAGWSMGRTARAWIELMRRLGYDRYGVHGGDIGAGVSGMIAGLDPEHVTGVHFVTDPMTAANTATFLPGLAESLNPDDATDRAILERMDAFRNDGSGYLAIQNTRPQTIGYGLTDSPVFLLAWIAEKLQDWTDVELETDQILMLVSIAWFAGAGATAAHTLYDQAHSQDWGAPPDVPQAAAVFGADPTVRRILPFPADGRWTEFEGGLHFPAMELPDVLADDLRSFFAPLR